MLEQREAGIALHRQAVLMRTAHHSDLPEIELGKRNIPFVKYGGLKFIEAAHVKDVICILRWAENPRDDVAGFRVLQLLPGVGPANARLILNGNGAMPATLHDLLDSLRNATKWPGQLGMVRKWYEPHLERLYESSGVRVADLEVLEQLAKTRGSREGFLSDLILDPPEAMGDLAGDPLIDDDFLILSTIHSAKGQEWDVVYVLNVVDGCIPSDMATGSKEEIEEERRLLYVAMTWPCLSAVLRASPSLPIPPRSGFPNWTLLQNCGRCGGPRQLPGRGPAAKIEACLRNRSPPFGQ